MKKIFVTAIVIGALSMAGSSAHAAWSQFLSIVSAASYGNGDFIVTLSAPTGAGCPADAEVKIQLSAVNRREATALIMTAQAMGKRISVSDAGCAPSGHVYLFNVATEP